MNQQKVTYLHQDLLQLFEQALGRPATVGEKKAIATLRRCGGESVDVALVLLIAEIGRYQPPPKVAPPVRRQPPVLEKRPRWLVFWAQLEEYKKHIVLCAAGFFLGGALVSLWTTITTPDLSLLENCLGGRGRIETTPTGERYCFPIDGAGQIIRWRVP